MYWPRVHEQRALLAREGGNLLLEKYGLSLPIPTIKTDRGQSCQPRSSRTHPTIVLGSNPNPSMDATLSALAGSVSRTERARLRFSGSTPLR